MNEKDERDDWKWEYYSILCFCYSHIMWEINTWKLIWTLVNLQLIRKDEDDEDDKVNVEKRAKEMRKKFWLPCNSEWKLFIIRFPSSSNNNRWPVTINQIIYLLVSNDDERKAFFSFDEKKIETQKVNINSVLLQFHLQIMMMIKWWRWW